MSEPISVASSSAVDPPRSGSGARKTAPAPASSLFGGPTPVSVVTWWKQHPNVAPADLAKHQLLLNQPGQGPQRFPGPDMRKYSRVLMVITCPKKIEYLVRLQVLDGLSIASTEGPSCGGPNVNIYTSPVLHVTEKQTEVEVQVAEGEKYFVTLYGTPVT